MIIKSQLEFHELEFEFRQFSLNKILILKFFQINNTSNRKI